MRIDGGGHLLADEGAVVLVQVAQLAQQALALGLVDAAVGLGGLDHGAQHQPGNGILLGGGGDLRLVLAGDRVVEDLAEACVVRGLRPALGRAVQQPAEKTAEAPGRRTPREPAQKAPAALAIAGRAAARVAGQAIQDAAQAARGAGRVRPAIGTARSGPAHAATHAAAEHLAQHVAQAAALAAAARARVHQVAQDSPSRPAPARGMAAAGLLLVLDHGAKALGQHHARRDAGQGFHQGHRFLRRKDGRRAGHGCSGCSTCPLALWFRRGPGGGPGAPQLAFPPTRLYLAAMFTRGRRPAGCPTTRRP